MLFKRWKIFAVFVLALAGCLWHENEFSSAADDEAYLPLDDSEYPYAGIPRLVLETENFREIRNRSTQIPARLQIYGKDSPESEIFELTVRGRGNSTYNAPKYGMKIKFSKTVKLFDMPEENEWALRSCYGDKTLLRDYLMSRLGHWLGVKFTPKMQFVELYLNREYKGVYLLTESIKIGKNRVNIPKTENSFLLEKEDPKKVDDPYFKTRDGNLIHIKSPKNPSRENISVVKQHLNLFENYLHRRDFWGEDSIAHWLDIDDFLAYYWVQEFAKNEDGKFTRSVYFYWIQGGTIHFGPLWDFDLGFGNQSRNQFRPAENWFIRNYRWNKYILADSTMNQLAADYWKAHRETFRALIDSIPLYKKQIEKAAKNDFKRWPILDNAFTWALRHSYKSHDEAVDSMTVWTKRRFDWIDENVSK